MTILTVYECERTEILYLRTIIKCIIILIYIYTIFRANVEVPEYANVDLSQCPPPLYPKPMTPISPPTPVHTEIRNTSPSKPLKGGVFFPDRIPSVFEGNI